jgi:hypothetical protein
VEILCDGSVVDPPHTLAPLAGAGTCTVPGPTSRAMCEFQQGRWVPSMSATTAQAQKYGSRSAPPALEHARARCIPRVANCRGTWARVTVDQFRHSALRTG